MKSSPSALVPRRETPPDKIIRLYQSETAEILESPEPLRARVAIFLLAGCFAALIVVALVMRLDRVVTSNYGEIVTTRPTIVMQALNASIIKTLDVREGQRVRKGQLLATLDPTFAAADVAQVKLRLASLNAEIARAEAELAGKPYVVPTGLDPAAEQYAALQKAYYDQRKAEFDAQLNGFNQQVAQARAAIAKYQNDEVVFADRAEIAKEIQNMRQALARAQVGSKLNLLTATDERYEILRNLEFDHNLLAEKQHELQAAIAKRNAFVQKWLGDASHELVEAKNNRDTAREQLAKASKLRELVRLVAPEDAVVLKMAKLSDGSVLKEGEPLVYLAPLHSPVEAEIHVNARDIGFIRPGDPTTIKLSAFDFVDHGTAKGRIRWISQGSFTQGPADPTQQTDQTRPVAPYYKARVELTKIGLYNLPKNFRLLPGMTLKADIHIGTRSVFAYLMRGLIGGAGEAMREP